MKFETIPRQFLHSVETFDRPGAFRYKRGDRWVSVSHRDYLDRVHRTALALGALPLARGDRVAILSENRIEWAVADLAILAGGGVTVPIYATLPADQVEYILGDSEARAVFVSDASQLAKVVACRDRLPTLEHVISFDDCGDDAITLDALVPPATPLPGDAVFSDLIAPISGDDRASIIYTSGTTGPPKGVILTHRNFMSNVHACLDVFTLGDRDVALSFLPLSHAFERTAGFYVMFTAGTQIAFAQSPETVVADMRVIHPTVMCSVPRIYEKMFAGIRERVEQSSGARRTLFWWAVAAGIRYVEENLAGGAGATTRLRRRLADALALRRIREATGGRVRFFISGGAPLSPEIAIFFHAVGAPVMEGYGLTETAPVIAVNTVEHFRFGTVGHPLPGVEVSVADDGEILVRGDNVMAGYYKRPQETEEALRDGWFHTGDIGHFDPDGFLVITDRKKDLIVTAGGKNVAPQPVEGLIKRSPWIEEIVLVGNRRPFISAVIVPNFDRLEALARDEGTVYADRSALVRSPRIHALFEEELARICAHLASYEQPKKFILLDREFSLEENEITPSLKIKRRIVEEKLRDRIDGMYAR